MGQDRISGIPAWVVVGYSYEDRDNPDFWLACYYFEEALAEKMCLAMQKEADNLTLELKDRIMRSPRWRRLAKAVGRVEVETHQMLRYLGSPAGKKLLSTLLDKKLEWNWFVSYNVWKVVEGV